MVFYINVLGIFDSLMCTKIYQWSRTWASTNYPGNLQYSILIFININFRILKQMLQCLDTWLHHHLSTWITGFIKYTWILIP